MCVCVCVLGLTNIQKKSILIVSIYTCVYVSICIA